jgi:AmpE protein
MNFLVLLLVVAVEKFSSWRRRIQVDRPWLRQLRQFETRRGVPMNAWLVLILLVVVPCVILAMLLSLLHPIAYGLLALPVHLTVLVYSLGRGGVQAGLGPFRDACRRGDIEGAYLVAQRDLGVEADNTDSLVLGVQQRFMWQAFEGFFSVVFWYVLLGPVVALGYRLNALVALHATRPELRERAAQIQHALDWLPARALAVTFGLVGDFVALNQALLGRLLDWEVSAAQLVTDVARSASEICPPSLDEDGNAALDALWQLLVRSAVFWYVVFALWVVFV